jgi:hypothetical protein
MDDLVQRMRGDIDVRIEKKDSLRVSYISSDATTAQRVTERLASLFVEETCETTKNWRRTRIDFPIRTLKRRSMRFRAANPRLLS